ncbi:MAG TPA: PRC and DUF2382 domain-containing protein [Gaiellaceae bacterium]|nr:PRC and DUF2382 domain-containing protein [Gaiellaceae bacterium]
MRDEWTIERLGELRGSPVYDSAGEKIGKVEDLFYDTQTGRPEWIGLGTGLFGTKHLLVPVAGAEARDDGVFVPYSKDQVKDSPDVDADELSPADESSLYGYYGLEGGYGDIARAGADEPRDGGSVTRTEEELKVGKRTVEAGQVRVRKWVETEPVEAEVELTRERATVRRERIDEPAAGHDFREEEIEVPLRAEEPVVEKQAVAKERISVGKQAERDTRTVTETVRKERVDVDGDDADDVDPR